jgi:hypothetical protein
MKTPTPTTPRSRGIDGVQKPGQGKQKSSGIGDLQSPRIDGGGPTRRAVPSADEPIIKGMEEAAQDARTAGAQGEQPRHGEGSQRGNIPGGVGDLIAPDGFRVP